MNSKREGAAALKVPERFARLCEVLVNSAYGYGPPPAEGKELESFRNWVIYEGGAEADLWLDSFVCIADLEFSDDEVRDDFELEEEDEVTDAQRLAYARAFVDGYDNGFRDPQFIIVAKIKRRSGKPLFGGTGTAATVIQNSFSTGCVRMATGILVMIPRTCQMKKSWRSGMFRNLKKWIVLDGQVLFEILSGLDVTVPTFF